jgi:hypothetical protein
MRDTIDIAREAGAHPSHNPELWDIWEVSNEALNRLVALVRADQREIDANVCDDINAKYKWPDDVAERVASQWCADAIRARGNT